MSSFDELVNQFNYKNKRIFTLEEMSVKQSGKTFAHYMALNGYYFPEDHLALKLMDDQGITVAHYVVSSGHRFTDASYALNLKTSNGLSVKDLTKELDNLNLHGKGAFEKLFS